MNTRRHALLTLLAGTAVLTGCANPQVPTTPKSARCWSWIAISMTASWPMAFSKSAAVKLRAALPW